MAMGRLPAANAPQSRNGLRAILKTLRALRHGARKPMRPPDLGATGLNLVGGRLLPSLSGPAAAFFMYEASSGERFTIYCRRAKAPESALRYRATGAVGSFSWVGDEIAFVVTGPADRARLQKVAEAVYEQVESRQQTGMIPRALSDARY